MFLTLFLLNIYVVYQITKTRSNCLVLEPGARKNLSVLESHTTDNFQRLV